MSIVGSLIKDTNLPGLIKLSELTKIEQDELDLRLKILMNYKYIDIDILELLISKGANIHRNFKCDKNIYTLLDLLSFSFESLLHKSNEYLEKGVSSKHDEYEDYFSNLNEVFNLLYEKGVTYTFSNKSIIHYAIRYGIYDIIEKCLENGVDTNTVIDDYSFEDSHHLNSYSEIKKYTLLGYAYNLYMSDYYDIFIFERGHSEDEEYEVIDKFKQNILKIIRLLLDKGAKLDTKTQKIVKIRDYIKLDHKFNLIVNGHMRGLEEAQSFLDFYKLTTSNIKWCPNETDVNANNLKN